MWDKRKLSIEHAKWICHPEDGREKKLVPVFKKIVTVEGELRSAVLSITSHGVYETTLNGIPVTENKFNPGLTSYYHRIQVQTYDITRLLHDGENIWETTVGDGWWRWNNNFGYMLALLGQLELNYMDGTVVHIGTDESFSVATGSIQKSDLREGEVFHAGIEPEHWIHAVECKEYIGAELIDTQGVPMREKEQFKGKPFKDTAGNLIIDFGQNIAGYVQMKLKNTKPGQMIHLKHGEGLNPEGVFSTSNCDGGIEKFQEITYICKGGECEVYQPKFSIFGFRYLLVDGVEDGDFTAIAVYSDMEETGDFTCSNELINKLVENARWSQKGNFLDVAVDCPTRERNAWTGDAQIYCRTAAYFMNVSSFFDKWLVDQSIEQFDSGKVGITFPSTSSVHNPEELAIIKKTNPAMALAGPTGNGNIGEDSVGWGDSAVWIPYQMYLMYGNKEILARQYLTAKRWVEYSLTCMKDVNPMYMDKPWYQNGDGDYIYDTKFHYGEWNEPLPPSPEVIELFAKGGTTADFVTHMAQYGNPEVATAYTCRSCDNLAHMAEILGISEDEKKYHAIAEKIRNAYDKYMIADDGTIQPGHQAAYVRALALNLVSEEKKEAVRVQLKKEIEAADYHLNTGFLSTVYLLPTLCDNGMEKEAFQILEQTDAPGWLHPICLGATTMLERWEGMDTFRDSFNHYSFGAVCQFLFEYVAGIRPIAENPGFAEFSLKPTIGGTLTWAEGSYKTRYGTIFSRWELSDNNYKYICKVPNGTKAHLTLPDRKMVVLEGGAYEFTGEYNKTGV